MRTSEERQRDLEVVRAKLEKLGWVDKETCDDWVSLGQLSDGELERTDLQIYADDQLPTYYKAFTSYYITYLRNIPEEVSKLLPEFRFCRFYWRTDLKDPLDK